MTPDNARNAAFCLRAAADELRTYALLMAENIERPARIDLALNNISSGLFELGIFVTTTKTASQLHDSMKAGQQREAAMFDSAATCNVGLTWNR